MEITFNWDADDVLNLVLALEDKGFTELADKVDTSFKHNLATFRKKDANKQFRDNGWNDGRVFHHSNGDITCIYWSYKNKCYSTIPMYINGRLMGRTSTLDEVNARYMDLTEAGFKRVETGRIK